MAKAKLAPPRKKTTHVSQMMKAVLPASFFRSVDEFSDDDYCDAIANYGKSSKLSKSKRDELKNLSRWETDQNTWLKGISRTKRNDIIGTGPRVQVCDERFEDEQQFEISRQFNNWLKDIRFASSLRLMVGSEHDEGESFGFVYEPTETARANAPWNYPNPLDLHFRVMDSDRFTDLTMDGFESGKNDGISYDEHGNPVEYRALRAHPSDADFVFEGDNTHTPISSQFVFHFFQTERPEQCRGIPEGAAGLGLASKIRNYTGSIVQAMCNAAHIGGYLTTELDPMVEVVYDDDGVPEQDENGDIKTEVDCPEDGESFDANPDAVQCLPRGYDYKQHETPNVVNDHVDFIHGTVAQIGAASCMPRHKSTKDSSNYNYSSVRADGQDWHTCVKIYRSSIEWDLTRLFVLWWERAVLNREVLSEEIATVIASDDDLPSYPEHTWHWDGMPHVDPSRESRAQKERLSCGAMDLYDLHAEAGRNWDEEIAKAARSFRTTEEEYMECVKVSVFPNIVQLLQTRARENSNVERQRLRNEEVRMQIELKRVELDLAKLELKNKSGNLNTSLEGKDDTTTRQL